MQFLYFHSATKTKKTIDFTVSEHNSASIVFFVFVAECKYKNCLDKTESVVVAMKELNQKEGL